MATDGTGIEVIVCSSCRRAQRLQGTDRNRDVAVFQYEADKSSELGAAKLRSFQGTLTAAAEHRFNAVFASDRVIEAGCNAMVAGSFATPKTRSQSSPPKAAPSSARSMASKRRRGSRPHRRQAPRTSAADAPPDHRELRRLDGRLRANVAVVRSHWRRRFATTAATTTRSSDSSTTPSFPSTTRPPSASFGMWRGMRLSMLFAGSTHGAHRAGALLGIIATCRAQGIHAQAYLTWAFERLGTHRDLFDLSLRPDASGVQEDARQTIARTAPTDAIRTYLRAPLRGRRTRSDRAALRHAAAAPRKRAAQTSATSSP